MADKDDGARLGADGRRRRPPRTIEGEAVEIPIAGEAPPAGEPPAEATAAVAMTEPEATVAESAAGTPAAEHVIEPAMAEAVAETAAAEPETLAAKSATSVPGIAATRAPDAAPAPEFRPAFRAATRKGPDALVRGRRSRRRGRRPHGDCRRCGPHLRRPAHRARHFELECAADPPRNAHSDCGRDRGRDGSRHRQGASRQDRGTGGPPHQARGSRGRSRDDASDRSSRRREARRADRAGVAPRNHPAARELVHPSIRRSSRRLPHASPRSTPR